MKLLLLIFASISSTFSITLNCQYSTQYFNEIGDVYGCIKPTLSKIAESQQITAISGTHVTGKSNADVRAFYIYGQTDLTYFPRGVEKFFPNLQGVIIIYTNITTLKGDELDAMPNLRHFQFTANRKFERVPGNLFKNNPLLVFVSFASNNIKYVGEKILDGLNSIRYFTFAYNYCATNINATYPTQSIPNLVTFLKQNCTDIAPSCNEISVNENVCKLQEQNAKLIEKNTALESKVNQLVLNNLEINQKLDRLIMDASVIPQVRELVNQIIRKLMI